jgi:hypothetical protein
VCSGQLSLSNKWSLFFLFVKVMSGLLAGIALSVIIIIIIIITVIVIKELRNYYCGGSQVTACRLSDIAMSVFFMG